MKILNELDELVSAEVISAEVAERIRNYAQERARSSSSHRLLLIFGSLGALLIGLGVIVLLAHNWDELPRWTKTFISFLPLLAGQAACGYLLFKKGIHLWHAEAVAIFTSLSVGAAIAMIHQVYNLPESSFANFLSLWLLLALPTLYLMRSRATAVLYYIGCCVLAALGSDKEWTTFFIALLAFALALPFYLWHIREKASSYITGIFHWAGAAFVACIVCSFLDNIDFNNDYAFCLVMLAGAYLIIGKYLQSYIYYNAYKVSAICGLAICFFVKEIFYVNLPPKTIVSTILLFAFVYLPLLIKYYSLDKKEQTIDLILFYPILYILLAFTQIAYLYDLAILALGSYYLWKGFKSERTLLVNFGLVVISAQVVYRFFDSSLSFVLKGIVFILLGISFFVVNYLILKQKKNA